MKFTRSEQVLIFIIGMIVEILGLQEYIIEPIFGVIIILFAGTYLEYS